MTDRRKLIACAALALLIATPAAAKPDLSGFWGPVFEPGEPEPGMVALLPEDTVIIDDTGVAEFGRNEFGGLLLKPEAARKAQQWDPQNDMTIARVCLPPSIVYSLQGPFPFEIVQTRDLIVIRNEYFDQVRLVHMDGRGHPGADYPHSKMGHSTGHWVGEELVIDTTHIAASTITNNGLDHTDDVHMVERYRLSGDGRKLVAMQIFEDDNVLDNKGARWIEWEKRADYIYLYECDPTFALEYADTAGAEGE
jgi:hypothetical protein